MQDLIISLVQAEIVWENPELNRERFRENVLPLSGKTDLVILPEVFTTGFSINPPRVTEDMEGPTVRWMKELARETGSVITGSFLCSEGGHVMNRLLWAEPGGVTDYYDKRHLFRMANEHASMHAGSKRLIRPLKGWNICPMICYDLRFPVWSKNRFIRGSYEYDLLIYIANWPETRKQAFTSLLTARAIENLSFCAGVNRCGSDATGKTYSGNSMVAGPDGSTIITTTPYKEEIVTLSLSRDALENIRSILNAGQDWDDFEIFDSK